MRIATTKGDIYVSEEEAKIIKQSQDQGVRWIDIGEERLQSNFIIGIFKGEDPNWTPEMVPIERRIASSGEEQSNNSEKLERIANLLQEMRDNLTERGVIGFKAAKTETARRYQKACDEKDQKELQEKEPETQQSTLEIEKEDKLWKDEKSVI